MAKGRSCLSFIFGFIFAIVLIVGTVIGGGIWVYKAVTLNNVEGWFKFEIPLDESSGIKDKTIEKMAKELGVMFSDTDNMSLSSLENYFGLNSIIPAEVMGISLAPIKEAKFSNMKEGINKFVDSITIEKLTSEDGLNVQLPDIPIINDIKNQSITEGFSTLADSLKVDKLRVSDLKNKFGMELGNNKLLNSLVERDTDENPILISEIDKEIGNLKFQDVLSAEDMGKLYEPLKDKKISEFSTAVNGLKLNQLLTINNESSKFLKAIQDKTVDDLSSPTFINGIRIKDIFETPTSIIQSIINEEVDGQEATYVTVSNLQEKLTAKINTATLSNLKSWGCLTGISDADLNKTISQGAFNGQTLGSLTVTQLITAAISVLTSG